MKDDGKCKTCGSKSFPISPNGYCTDVNSCTERRIARTKPKPLVGPCVVKIQRYGRIYWLEEFQAQSTDVGFVISPPRFYYQAVLEENSASSFKPEKALLLAKEYDGEAVEK